MYLNDRDNFSGAGMISHYYHCEFFSSPKSQRMFAYNRVVCKSGSPPYNFRLKYADTPRGGAIHFGMASSCFRVWQGRTAKADPVPGAATKMGKLRHL